MKNLIGAIAVFVMLGVISGTCYAQGAFAQASPNAGSQAQQREQVRVDDESGLGDMEREREQERVMIAVPPAIANDAAKLASANADIRGIAVDPEQNRVEVTYRLRAKLFGLIDVPYELQARVQTQEGEMRAEAKGPWWLIFAADNADEVQDALEADTTLTTATNQGTILSTIIGILKSLAQ